MSRVIVAKAELASSTSPSTRSDAESRTRPWGRRGHTRGPLYKARRLLVAASERITKNGRIKLRGLLTAKGWRNRKNRALVLEVIRILPLHPVVHYVDSMTSETTQVADLISSIRRRTIECTPGMQVLNNQLTALRPRASPQEPHTHTHRPLLDQPDRHHLNLNPPMDSPSLTKSARVVVIYDAFLYRFRCVPGDGAFDRAAECCFTASASPHGQNS